MQKRNTTKSQTSVELLVLLGMILVIAAVALALPTLFTTLGGYSQEKTVFLTYAQNSPLAISRWITSDYLTTFEIKNTGSNALYLSTFLTDCVNVRVEQNIDIGSTYTITIPGRYEPSITAFKINYTDDSNPYVFESTKKLGNRCVGVLNGLTAYWKFENNNYDSSLNANHAIQTQYSLPTFVAGANGFSANFNGINQTIVINDSVSLNSQNISREFTIAFFFKMNSIDSNTLYPNFIAKQTGAVNRDFLFYFFNTTKIPAASFGNSTDLTNLPAYGDAFNASTWYHFAAVVRGSTLNVRTYTNGKYYTQHTAYSGILMDTIANVTIGSVLSTSQFLNGSIDEILLFNRTLTDSEIALLAVR